MKRETLIMLPFAALIAAIVLLIAVESPALAFLYGIGAMYYLLIRR